MKERSLRLRIHETTEFLGIFLKNLLLNEHNELHNRPMHISGLLKPDVRAEKPEIRIPNMLGYGILESAKGMGKGKYRFKK